LVGQPSSARMARPLSICPWKKTLCVLATKSWWRLTTIVRWLFVIHKGCWPSAQASPNSHLLQLRDSHPLQARQSTTDTKGTTPFGRKQFGRQTFGQHDVWETQLWPCHLVDSQFVDKLLSIQCRPNVCQPNVCWQNVCRQNVCQPNVCQLNVCWPNVFRSNVFRSNDRPATLPFGRKSTGRQITLFCINTELRPCHLVDSLLVDKTLLILGRPSVCRPDGIRPK
jgi:hypothetical protein